MKGIHLRRPAALTKTHFFQLIVFVLHLPSTEHVSCVHVITVPAGGGLALAQMALLSPA